MAPPTFSFSVTVLVLLACAGCAGKETSNNRLRALEPVTQVHVVTPTAWWLRIHADGSGSFGHGAEGGTSARFPSGVFDTGEIAKALELRAVDAGDMANHFSVLVVRRGDTHVRSRYVKTAELIAPMFEQARARRAGDGALMRPLDEAWEKTPPVEEKTEALPPVRIGV